MSIKLVASDIDGTLVNNNKDLLPSTKQAVRAFTDRGGVFVIATGRPISGIRRYIKELELDKRGGLLISYNGSFILDTVTEKPILQHESRGRDDIPDHPGDTIPNDGQSGTRIGISRTC